MPWDSGDILSPSRSAALLNQSDLDGVKSIVAGGFVVNNEGRLLILRRSRGEFLAGEREIPSGKLKHGESIYEALRREIFEETGLSISTAYGPINQFDYYASNGELSRQFNFAVVVKTTHPIRLSREHDLFEWVSADELNSAGLDVTMRNVVSGFFDWLNRRKDPLYN